jgi:hypothetical protein
MRVMPDHRRSNSVSAGKGKRLAIEIAGRTALVLGSILFTLVFLELGCRLWRGPSWLVHWPNIARETLEVTKDWPVCSHVQDPHLGWTANPNYRSAHFNVGPDGYRVTGALPPGAEDRPAILATGDSFTEGDEVDDAETWPALLQGMLGRRVINAGVSGFGLDQTVLRTEEAVASTHPALGIVSFVPDDVRRTEFSRLWSVQKPYFVLQDGKLSLRNHPVPPAVPCDSAPFWQRAFGWSVLVDGVVHRQGWEKFWFYYGGRALPAGEGEKLACPLVQRLSRLDTPLLVVAQFGRATWSKEGKDAPRQHALSRRVLACAAAAGFDTLDLFDMIEQAVRSRGVDAIYKVEHHTGEGNRLVARAIAGELERRR